MLIVKKKNIKFAPKGLFYILISVVITFLLALYVHNLLYENKNSLKVYTALKIQKEQLQYNIQILQFENAKLQKEYFELKNLEPEE